MDRKINTLTILPIGAADATALSKLAKAIYVEYYLHLWHPGGADWYMNEYAYPIEKLRIELEDSNNRHYMVFDEEKNPAGYLKLRLHAALPGFETSNCLEVERIYLHRSIAGKGIGKQLMLLSEEIAREHSKDLIFLKAMDTSEEAILFYQHMGYQLCGTLQLPFPLLKDAYRGMVILSKSFVKM